MGARLVASVLACAFTMMSSAYALAARGLVAGDIVETHASAEQLGAAIETGLDLVVLRRFEDGVRKVTLSAPQSPPAEPSEPDPL